MSQRHDLIFIIWAASLGIAACLCGHFFGIIGLKYFLISVCCPSFALFFLEKPVLGAALFIFLLPFSDSIIISHIEYYDYVTFHWHFVYLAILCGALSILKRKVDFRQAPIKTPLIFFSVVWLGSFFSSAHKLDSFKPLFALASAFFLYYIFSQIIYTKKHIKIVLQATAVSSVIPIIVGISQYLLGVGFMKEYRLCVSSIFVSIHSFSFNLMVWIPAIVALVFLSKSRMVKLFYAFLSLAAFVCLYLSYTRSAWVAASVMIVVFFSMVARSRKMFYFVLCAGIFLLVCVIPRWIIPMYDTLLPSFSGRITLWLIFSSFILSRPFFGSGLRTVSYIGMKNAIISRYPHNLYIKLALELGITGLVFYLAILFIILKQAIWVYKNSQDYYFRVISSSIVGLIAAWAVAGMSEEIVPYRVSYPLFIILCSLMGSSKRILAESWISQ